VGTAAAQAAKHATKTIPIVVVSVGDPVGSGLVTSLARPGGNLTGLSVHAPGAVPKALEFLKEAAPSVSRVAVWIDLTNPGQTLADQDLDAAAQSLGVRAERIDVRTAANLDAAFAAALRQPADACSCIRCQSRFVTFRGSRSLRSATGFRQWRSSPSLSEKGC
jgi:ABC-type uncharacterized transport system substrate-binding protein